MIKSAKQNCVVSGAGATSRLLSESVVATVPVESGFDIDEPVRVRQNA